MNQEFGGTRPWSILDHARFGLFVVDAGLRIIEANAVAREHLGDGVDPVGKTFAEAVRGHWPDDLATEVEHLLVRCLASGERHDEPEAVETDPLTGATRALDWRLERFEQPDGTLAVLCSFRDVTAQLEARRALEDSERRYRSLFESMDQGFCLIQVEVDDRGEPHDYVFLETNPAFERHTGWSDVVGRSIRSLLPEGDWFWIDRYGRVAVTGNADRFVDEVPSMGRWYDEYAFPVGDPGERKVGVVFTDVTERVTSDAARRASEEALRRSEARQRFLLDLADELRKLSDADTILDVAMRRVGEHLGANRVGFADVGDDGAFRVIRPYTASGLPIAEGRLDLDAAAPGAAAGLHAGLPVLVEDAQHDPDVPDYVRTLYERYGVAAAATVPLVKQGRLAAVMYVHHTLPHGWTDEELRLIEAVADRTWTALDQARAEAELRESEARYRLLFESIEEGFCVLDLIFDDGGRPVDARYLQVNPAFVRQTGLDVRVGATARELLGDVRRAWLDRLARAAAGTPGRVLDYSPLLGRWFDTFAFPVAGADGARVALLFSDVSERVRAEQGLRESEERYRLLTDSLPDVAWTSDADGASLAVNLRGSEMLGDAPPTMEAFIGGIVHPEDRDRVASAWHAARATEAAFDCQCRLRTRDGGQRWHLVRGAPVLGAGGRVAQWVGTMTDIDEQKQREHEADRRRMELQYRVHHDALTGLPNRVLFEDRLRIAIAAAERHDRTLAVLFVDLDGFKLVNDSLGHAAGDVVLEETAHRLRAAIRQGDTLARLHGDEFAILLPELHGANDAGALAQSLVAEIDRPFLVAGRTVVVGASIGISVFPQDATDAAGLVRAADVAMYRAKLDGKHEVRYFDPDMRAPALERATLVERLEGALDRGDITLTYQPQWDSRYGSVTAFEALLHWRDARLGVVPPDRLADVAEERGAFGDIVAWSLDAACRTARGLGVHAGLPVRMAYNVTGTRLMRGTFVPQLDDAVERHGLAAGQLELELTLEPDRYGDPALRRRLEHVRERGIRITFDRFGGAPGMLAPLLDLPVDAVKLDPSLVHRAASDARFRHALQPVVALLHDLQLDVLALGVETTEQRDVMLEFGCSRLQGFHFGAPATDRDAADLLRRQGSAALFRPIVGSPPAEVRTPG
jgi:diguanylate cyclase (GGDEF)-like protein/PAS domain S-box-containing protein